MDTNTPPVISDPATDKVPMDANLFHETPLGGVNVAVAPVDGIIYHEV